MDGRSSGCSLAFRRSPSPATRASAMPSVHVAIGMLAWLWGRSLSRLAAVVGGAFFALVMVGSVRLGWHYAIDGYVSIVVTAGLWWLAGWWVDQRSSKYPSPSPSANSTAQPSAAPNSGPKLAWKRARSV